MIKMTTSEYDVFIFALALFLLHIGAVYSYGPIL